MMITRTVCDLPKEVFQVHGVDDKVKRAVHALPIPMFFSLYSFTITARLTNIRGGRVKSNESQLLAVDASSC